MICDYMGNIENAEDNIEYILKVIWQDKRIISILENRTRDKNFEDLRNVLVDCIRVADYWCAQKWLGGGISPSIKRSVQSLERYYDLVPLLYSLTSSIEKHLYEYSELENYTTMACVYEPPEMMSADYSEDTDKLREGTYPFLYAVEDDSVSKDFEDDLMMQELYGGPEFSDTVIFSKMQEKKSDFSGITDPDETVQICRKCGEGFAMWLSVCRYCGTFSRIESRPDYAAESERPVHAKQGFQVNRGEPVYSIMSSLCEKTKTT